MKFNSLLLLLGAMVLSTTLLANDDDEAFTQLVGTCASCHAEDGNSQVETNPKLGGQYESYLIQALKSYRDGTRENAIMSGFAATLSDRDIKKLAAYFASQESVLSTASK